MVQSIMGLKDRALRRYIAVILLGVALSAALLGCTAATEPPVAQEVLDVSVVVESEPMAPDAPEEIETDPLEQEVELVTEFVPACDSILHYLVDVIDSSEVINLHIPRFERIFTFPIIQVVIFDDKALEETINGNIIEALRWMGEVFHYLHFANLEIHTESDRYLSFSYDVNLYDPRRTENFYYFVTMDMQTGERIMLNDLVDVSLDFAERIIAIGNFAPYPLGHYLDEHDNIDPYKLLRELEIASLTAREVYEYTDTIFSIYESLGPLMFRSSFLLKDDSIVIYQTSSSGGLSLDEISRIEIKLSYIQDFLKVRS